MSKDTRTITLSIRTLVSITVEAEETDGEVNVVHVRRINGLPTAYDVMEALDFEKQLDELDEAFAAAAPADKK